MLSSPLNRSLSLYLFILFLLALGMLIGVSMNLKTSADELPQPYTNLSYTTITADPDPEMNPPRTFDDLYDKLDLIYTELQANTEATRALLPL